MNFDVILSDYKNIDRDEALFLFESAPIPMLREWSRRIKKENFDKEFEFCTIINARSGLCSEDCKFCAQSSFNPTGNMNYPMLSVADIIARAQSDYAQGVRRFSIVTSGRSPSKSDLDRITAACCEIKKIMPDMGICVSLGFIDAATAHRLRDCGADRFHHNLETSEKYFERVCSTHTFSEKIATIMNCRDGGLDVCSGGIVGLGESKEDFIDMMMALRTLPVKSVPINILTPVAGTPFENNNLLDLEYVERVFHLARIILFDREVKFAAGRARYRELERVLLGECLNGAITGDMLTTTGKTINEDMKFIKCL